MKFPDISRCVAKDFKGVKCSYLHARRARNNRTCMLSGLVVVLALVFGVVVWDNCKSVYLSCDCQFWWYGLFEYCLEFIKLKYFLNFKSSTKFSAHFGNILRKAQFAVKSWISAEKKAQNFHIIFKISDIFLEARKYIYYFPYC